MMRVTDDQLIAYLDGGEDDPLVGEILERDPGARRRLAVIRRVRRALSGRMGLASMSLQERVGLMPAHRTAWAPPAALRTLSFDPLAAHRLSPEPGPVPAFLRGRDERQEWGELRIQPGEPVGAGGATLGELRAGRYAAEASLVRPGSSVLLRLCLRDAEAERPLAGVRANLLQPGSPVQRYITDAAGVIELPLPAGPATLRLELEETGEIRLVPAAGL
jgi:hypothetical protein